MWCLMAAPLLVATDIRNLTDIMKEVCNIHEMQERLNYLNTI